ncbi:MerR family transcriptional regulator [Fictibacillus phosphorivorans]|uniref:MerR family transcriptional regulator n=1 Tax=Fictibacillus phosphorivorans TaxID=1221500 RepID=UPI00203E0FC2|nr:MerR family transcriptional regulator [Fictibacillus phosphorivorans]MCM3718961.1 MerR family transcriptional regulator [Fictibacillus phosphorivorans]MCM3776583.1 MerR family transcriptional regulator [Fictibacillus phosphorivorans]
MSDDKTSYKHKKVMSIGIVRELTGLSERKIRYYEERKLIFPERTDRGTRKYSFSDVETLMEIANRIEDGVQTFEIKKEMKRKQQREERNKMIRGQINAQFNIRK